MDEQEVMDVVNDILEFYEQKNFSEMAKCFSRFDVSKEEIFECLRDYARLSRIRFEVVVDIAIEYYREAESN